MRYSNGCFSLLAIGFIFQATPAPSQNAVATRINTGIQQDNANASAIAALLPKIAPNALATLQTPQQQYDSATQNLTIREDENAAITDWQKLVSTWPQDPLATEARLQLADHQGKHNFTRALASLGQLLVTNLSTDQRARALLLCGRYNFQLGNIDKAASDYNAALQLGTLAEPGSREARVHLDAIADPNSTSALFVIYDRGLHFREAGGLRNLCWREWHVLVHQAANSEVRQRYTADPNAPLEDRAELLYRVAHATAELEDQGDGLVIAQQVLDLLAPRDSSTVPVYSPPDPQTEATDERATPAGIYCPISPQSHAPAVVQSAAGRQALFLIAYHQAHCGHFCHAIPIYRGLIDNSPVNAEVTVRAYEELSRLYEAQQDYLAAALLSDEFLTLHGQHMDAGNFQALATRTRLKSPDTYGSSYAAGHDALLAKLKKQGRLPDSSPAIAVSPPSSPPASASTKVTASATNTQEVQK